MKEFSGKVAVITGAASGIGQGLAEKAVSLGMNVLLSDLDETALDGLSKVLKVNAKNRIETHRCDVSKSEDVSELAEFAFKAFGRVDLLFNNAGVMMMGNAWEHTCEDWNWVMGVNLYGVVNGINNFVPRMMEQGTPARVINTASIAGFLSSPTTSIYSASKRAVVGLSESLHYELQYVNSNVKISVLCPGAVATEIADSDRNRPDKDQQLEDEEKLQTKASLQERIAAVGMPPSQVADIVFDAIRDDTFWIFTHPEYLMRIRQEAESATQLKTPQFSPL